MTFERRIVVGVEDIKTVILECVKCKTRICRSPDRAADIPFHCECGQAWRPQGMYEGISNAEPDFVRFIKAIPTLRTIKREHPLGFRILFEFEEPDGR